MHTLTADLIRNHREKWAAKGYGSCTPLVLLEKNNQIDTMIIAPQVDKEAALWAAFTANSAIAPDKIHLILDANMLSSHNVDPRRQAELKAEMSHYPEGYLQGLKAKGDKNIIDVLVWVSIEKKSLEIKNVFLPYKSKDNKIEWLVNDIPEGASFDGYITTALTTMIKRPSVYEDAQIKSFMSSISPSELGKYIKQTDSTMREAIYSLFTSGGFVYYDFNKSQS